MTLVSDIVWVARLEWACQQGIRAGACSGAACFKSSFEWSGRWVTCPQAQHHPLWLSHLRYGQICLFDPQSVLPQPCLVKLNMTAPFVAFRGKDGGLHIVTAEDPHFLLRHRLVPMQYFKVDTNTGEIWTQNSTYLWGEMPIQQAHHASTGRLLAMVDARTVAVLDADTCQEICRSAIAATHAGLVGPPLYAITQLIWSGKGNMFAALLERPDSWGLQVAKRCPKEVCIYDAVTGACLQAVQVNVKSIDVAWSSSLDLLTVLGTRTHPDNYDMDSSADEQEIYDNASDVSSDEGGGDGDMVSEAEGLSDTSDGAEDWPQDDHAIVEPSDALVDHALQSPSVDVDSEAAHLGGPEDRLLILDPVHQAIKRLATSICKPDGCNGQCQIAPYRWKRCSWDPSGQLLQLDWDSKDRRSGASIVNPYTGHVVYAAEGYHSDSIWAFHPASSSQPEKATLICSIRNSVALTKSNGEWHARPLQRAQHTSDDCKLAPDGRFLLALDDDTDPDTHLQIDIPGFQEARVGHSNDAAWQPSLGDWAGFASGWRPIYAFTQYPEHADEPIKHHRRMPAKLVLVDACAHHVICSLPLRTLMSRAIKKNKKGIALDKVELISWAPRGSHLALMFESFTMVVSFEQQH